MQSIFELWNHDSAPCKQVLWVVIHQATLVHSLLKDRPSVQWHPYGHQFNGQIYLNHKQLMCPKGWSFTSIRAYPIMAFHGRWTGCEES